MKKGLAFLTLLVLLGLSYARQESVISGKLLGYDGKPMLKAQVHVLSSRGERKALQSIDVTKDGSFEVKLDHTGLPYLNFTGTNHYELMMPLLPDKPLREQNQRRDKFFCVGGVVRPVRRGNAQPAQRLRKIQRQEL